MKSHRLSSSVTPERYTLTLKPDLTAFTFEGEEIIALKVAKPTRMLTLHAADLTIACAAATKITYDKKSETVTLTLKKPIKKGRYTLVLTFSGTLNNEMRGFYRSRYMQDGVEKHLATTQFEATDARRAFPCFDEPAHKAIFDVTLVIPPGTSAISNTVETSRTVRDDGHHAVTFAPTPKMSTYLAAFIVGEFEYVEGLTTSGTIVRVHVTQGKKHQTTFALDVAIRSLEFYERYFAIRFPLPIMDMVAIPDFSHGAMENWGAVTYRETALLIDPDHSSAAARQHAAYVIAHELAHQWFGNLVTMEWWTHLWLNEGFATYIGTLAVDTLFPEWETWTQFVGDDMGSALRLDALTSTHPIEIPVGHPDEISEIFDEISYEKGASITRMLAGYLGETHFRDGLRHYLKTHAYENASTTHLWTAFEKVSKKPVSTMMRAWTGKSGYPLITVAPKGDSFTVSQSRFYAAPFAKKDKPATVWQVPITSKEFGDALKVNVGETGFYRTRYPRAMQEALEPLIRSRTLPPADRLGLVRDAFALAHAGYAGTDAALALAGAYRNETDYTVWSEVIGGLMSVRNLIYGRASQATFDTYARTLLAPILKQVGMKATRGERHTTALLRSLILGTMIVLGDKPTIRAARALMKSKEIPADLRGAAYRATACEGGAAEHLMFIKRYQTETLQEERNRIGRALAQFSNPALLKKTLDFALSDAVRIQDTAHIVGAVWANPIGKRVAWEYTKRHWATIIKRYPPSTNMLKYFVKPMAQLTTDREAKEVATFFKTHKAPGLARTIAQTLERVRTNAAWLARDATTIDRWLKSR